MGTEASIFYGLFSTGNCWQIFRLEIRSKKRIKRAVRMCKNNSYQDCNFVYFCIYEYR